jgi:hypothetical protein
MGAFKIDAVGPNRIASVHGALHTISFFTVVLLIHPMMIALRKRFQTPALTLLPWVAPALVVAGLVVPASQGRSCSAPGRSSSSPGSSSRRANSVGMQRPERRGVSQGR